MSTRKYSLFKTIEVIILMMVVGICLLKILTSWNAQGQVFSMAKILFPAHSEEYSKYIFRVLFEEFDKFPQKHTGEDIEKDIVSVLHGTVSDGSSSIFRQFVDKTSAGKVAKMIIIEYATEKTTVYKNVLFDGEQYFAVVDITHDGSTGESQEHCYNNLIIITHPETGSKFVILTNDAGLTFEKLRNAQIGSDMNRIDSYQLFSYSD